MKKIVWLILVGFLFFGLSGCQVLNKITGNDDGDGNGKTLYGKVGDTLNSGYYKVTLSDAYTCETVEVIRNGNHYFEPVREGYLWLGITISISNAGINAAEDAPAALQFFKVTDSNNRDYEPDYCAGNEIINAFPSLSSLPIGGTQSGNLLFEVSKQSSGLKLIFQHVARPQWGKFIFSL